ncbi:MAG TPA: C2 family cysteine protease [Pirellulaceae bacterium]|jgi:hypothetical protein
MRFTPGVEQLETRAVPASLSLSAGVMTINGTSNSDYIVVRQLNGRVSVDGNATSYAATAVNALVVNSGAGNDTVNLQNLTTAWTKQITVRSASGTDSVRLTNGTLRTLSGANASLTIPAVVPTPRSGASSGGSSTTTDWFDANVHDAALKALLKTDYNTDHVLDRNDMLAVFQEVEHDGTVNTNEFTDLKAVANNTSLFGSSTYIVDLTRDVVLGNAANAHYQGTTLGNLTAGSTGAKLNNLVHKWFLGADHPNASYPGITVTYTTAAGTLFGAGGPKYTDVHQGAVGDCYFVATLGETALRTPTTIQSMFTVNGDGTYGVRFYQNGVSHYVTVDSQLPTYSGGWFLYANMGSYAGNASNVLWVALAEKAYAQLNESGWIRPAAWGGGQNSYNGIEGGMFTDVTAQIANRAGSNYNVSSTIDTSLNNAVTSGKLVGFASTSNPTNSQIVGDHQYVVIGYNSSTKTVTLFNPWGINNGSQYPGLVSLTLSQLAGNFDYWSVA